jgi:hypothetical protein
MSAIILNLKHFTSHLSDRDLEILSRDNPDARLETNSINEKWYYIARIRSIKENRFRTNK